MRSPLLPSLALIVSASIAHADERVTTATKIATTAPTPRFALAVNSPLGWIGGESIGISAYAGITKNVAIRANVASYVGRASTIGDAVRIAIAADDEGAYESGRVLDVGVGVVHYSRGLWDGFTVEGGVLRRDRDVVVTDEFASAYKTSTDTAAYAGRALFGWSWLIKKRVFIAAAIGGAVGVEAGTETTENERGQMKKTHDVDRSYASFEGYLRLGGAF